MLKHLLNNFVLVENLTTRMQGNTMNIGYDSVNGDQNDEEFEDAD